jgi:hypothetical protein
MLSMSENLPMLANSFSTTRLIVVVDAQNLFTFLSTLTKSHFAPHLQTLLTSLPSLHLLPVYCGPMPIVGRPFPRYQQLTLAFSRALASSIRLTTAPLLHRPHLHPHPHLHTNYL